jgi:hypothetical protein
MCVMGMQSELDEASTLFFHVRQKKSAVTVDWNVSRHGGIASNSCSFYVESKVCWS